MKPSNTNSIRLVSHGQRESQHLFECSFAEENKYWPASFAEWQGPHPADRQHQRGRRHRQGVLDRGVQALRQRHRCKVQLEGWISFCNKLIAGK